MENKKIYLSDIIGDAYKSWNNEKVILDCGTGRGKTYFIINSLCLYAAEKNKSVLYLCNRIKLIEQIKNNVERIGLLNVDVMSYQRIQKEKTFRDKHYDYIIADEVHYILDDASFNYYTDITYNYLTNQKNNVVIFMSATGKSLFGWLCNRKVVTENRRYVLDTDYSYVDKVYFYNYKELNLIIDDILSRSMDDKIIVFVNSSEQMLNMNKIYKEKANYYCSASSKELKKIRQENCIVAIDENNITFEKRLLFTTTALDNGVDLKDEKIKYIISEIIDPFSAIQCIGRKRPKNNKDKCNIFIADYDKTYISKRYRLNNLALEPVNLFKLKKNEFIEKYGHDRTFHNQYIYNDWDDGGKPKLNEVGFIKLTLNKIYYHNMLEVGFKQAMCAIYMSKELVKKVNKIAIKDVNNNVLEEFLESIVGKQLNDSDKDILVENVKKAGLKARTYGLNSINNLFKDNFYNYEIVSRRIRNDERKQVTVWIVHKI